MNAHRTPVLQLNNDTLSRIFILIALDDIPMHLGLGLLRRHAWEQRALVIIWACSHVSHGWRALILNLPSLWGCIIDFPILSRLKEEWRHEIIRRTGHSDLLLRGFVDMRKPGEGNFFYTLIKEHWARIRVLKVEFDFQETIAAHTRDMLSRPAPVLQVFEIKFRHHPSGRPSASSAYFDQLIAKTAPSIRILTLDALNLRMSRNSNMEWISGLRELVISHTTSMSHIDWLFALERMPNIECLIMDHAISVPDSANVSTALQLQNLKYIGIHDEHLQSSIAILSCLTPRLGCSLSLTAKTSSDYEQLTMARDVVSRYFSNFLRGIPSRDLNLIIRAQNFTIEYPSPTLYSLEFIVDIYPGPKEDLHALHLHFDAFSYRKFDTFPSLPLFETETATHSIRSFRFYSPETKLVLKPEVPIVPSVRQLIVCSEPSVSAEDWLQALKHMPLIEFLEMENTLACQRPETSICASAHLPHLRTINMKGSLSSCVTLLDGIIPRDGCCLHSELQYTEYDVLPSSLTQMLSRYSQSFFEHNLHTVTGLVLWVSHDRLSIGNGRYYKDLNTPTSFIIEIESIPRSHIPILLHQVLQGFHSPNFENITTLEFYTILSLSDPLAFRNVERTICNFLPLLRNVRTILTERSTSISDYLYRGMLTPYCNQNGLLFPKLSKLMVKQITYKQPSFYQRHPELRAFLSLRQKLNMPVDAVDLTLIPNDVKLEEFEEFKGLKVIYRSSMATRFQEHICEGVGLLTAIFRSIDRIFIII